MNMDQDSSDDDDDDYDAPPPVPPKNPVLSSTAAVDTSVTWLPEHYNVGQIGRPVRSPG
jgi:hypothetical protein